MSYFIKFDKKNKAYAPFQVSQIYYTVITGIRLFVEYNLLGTLGKTRFAESHSRRTMTLSTNPLS